MFSLLWDMIGKFNFNKELEEWTEIKWNIERSESV